MAFPTSPTNGQQANINGITYTYSSAATAWTVSTSVSNTFVSINVSDNVNSGNVLATGVISATGNVSGSNLVVTGNIIDTGALTIVTGSNGNITLSPNGTGIVAATGAISTTGNISANNATFTSNQTLSYGTANGVVYLDSNKVATSGAALVFDGTALVSSGSGTQSLTVTSTATAAYVQTTGANTVNARLQSNAATASVGTTSNHNFFVQTNSNNVGTFDTDSNFGLGTTATNIATYRVLAIGVGSAQGGILQFQGASGADGAHIRMDRTGSSITGFNIETRSGSNAPISLITNSTTAVTIDTSQNVGIGTSSPTSRLHVSHPSAATNAIAQFTNGTTGVGVGNGLYVGIDTSNEATVFNFYNSALKFGTNGSERARFNTTGAFVLAGGTTTANGIGITFPATQSASTDANTLDDYEEGTWTPTIQGLSGGACVMTSGVSGVYTKIGNVVYCTCSIITWSSKTTLLNNVILSGLPFPFRSGQRFAGNFGTSPGGSLSFTGQPVFGADGGASYAWFIIRDGTNNTYTHMTDANINSSGTIYGVTITYVV